MTDPARLLSDLSGATANLSHVSVPLLALGLTLQTLGLMVRGVAWRNVLQAAYPEHAISRRRITGIYLTGVAGNSVLPAKGGEVVKVALARGHVNGSSTSGVVGTMGVITVFDLVAGTVLALGLLFAGAVPGAGPSSLASGLSHPMVLAASSAVVAAVSVAAWRSDRVRRKVRGELAGAWTGLTVLRSPVRYIRSVAALQLIAWVCRIAVAGCLLAAFGLPATPETAAVVVIAGSLAGLMPASPGGLGAEQVLVAYALGGSAATGQIVVFALGAQLAVIGLQIVLGVLAAMLMMRMLHPARAISAVRGLAGAEAA